MTTAASQLSLQRFQSLRMWQDKDTSSTASYQEGYGVSSQRVVDHNEGLKITTQSKKKKRRKNGIKHVLLMLTQLGDYVHWSSPPILVTILSLTERTTSENASRRAAFDLTRRWDDTLSPKLRSKELLVTIAVVDHKFSRNLFEHTKMRRAVPQLV